MSLHLEIPESVASSLKLPTPEPEPRLLRELAVALYAESILSFGKACELAGSSRYTFGELIASRGILRHYTDDDLMLDLEYARGQ